MVWIKNRTTPTLILGPQRSQEQPRSGKTQWMQCNTFTSFSASKVENSLFSRIIMSFFTAAIWDITRCNMISCQNHTTDTNDEQKNQVLQVIISTQKWKSNRLTQPLSDSDSDSDREELNVQYPTLQSHLLHFGYHVIIDDIHVRVCHPH